VVGNYYDRHIVRKARIDVDMKCGAQNIQAPKQGPIEIIHALFVRLVANPIEANPLNGMENKNRNSK